MTYRRLLAPRIEPCKLTTGKSKNTDALETDWARGLAVRPLVSVMPSAGSAFGISGRGRGREGAGHCGGGGGQSR